MIERRFEIHDFHVGPTEFGSWYTDDTVPHYFCFCRDHVGCMGREHIRIMDKVAAHHDPNSIWVAFLGAVVDDNSSVCDSSIFQDASDFIMGEVENRVGANLTTFFSLRKGMQLL